jgi:hypothetical protein
VDGINTAGSRMSKSMGKRRSRMEEWSAEVETAKETAQVFHARTRELNSFLYSRVRHLPARLSRRDPRGDRQKD